MLTGISSVTLQNRLVNFIIVITGARIFGHGRRVELLLSIAAGTYAIELLLVRNATSRTVVSEDVFWGGYGHYMLIVMWLLFVVTSCGLWFNIKAWPGSRLLRLVGAWMGLFMWGWFGTKLALLGVTPSPGQVLACIVGFVAEPMVIFNAAINLPIPGAPGDAGGDVGR